MFYMVRIVVTFFANKDGLFFYISIETITKKGSFWEMRTMFSLCQQRTVLYTQIHSDGFVKKNTLVFIALNFYFWIHVLYYYEYVCLRILKGKIVIQILDPFKVWDTIIDIIAFRDIKFCRKCFYGIQINYKRI